MFAENFCVEHNLAADVIRHCFEWQKPC